MKIKNNKIDVEQIDLDIQKYFWLNVLKEVEEK